MDKRGENSFSEEVRSGRKTRESFGYGPKSAVTEQQGHRTQSEANGCCDWQEGDKKKYHPCAINNLWKTDFPPSIQCAASLISTRNRCVLKMCKQVSDLQC